MVSKYQANSKSEKIRRLVGEWDVELRGEKKRQVWAEAAKGGYGKRVGVSLLERNSCSSRCEG
jgi:hypothetical protein